MAKLRLHILPKDEPVLRAVNAEITFPLSKELKECLSEMKSAVQEFKGIGLAAPQIGKNFRLAMINLQELGIKPFAIINPLVVSKSIKKTEMEEGCLSIPKFFVKIRRPAKVEVEAYREDGKRVIIKADKLLAKVLQHEIDHLNGTLICDKWDIKK